VIFGKAQGFGPVLELADLDGKNGFRMDGAAAKDRSGRAISSAGDINGDGYADMAIGAMLANPSSGARAGSTYVVFGKPGGFAPTLDLGDLNGVNGFRIDGKAQERSGVSVATAGDVNGDGFGDLIIGAYYANPNGDNSGSSYVVFGKASGFGSAINLSTLNGSNGFRIDGAADYDQSGRAVSAAGDVNGDGLGDLLVGAPGASHNGEMSGSSYIIYGSKPIGPVVRTGSNVNQTLAGGDQADTLDGKGGDDVLFGHAGADTIYGGSGRDDIDGGDGNDWLSGGLGRDTMAAGLGDDTVTGDEDNDILGGGLGNDLVIGGTGADRMFGADGDDNFNSGSGRDTMVGGAGHDRFFFTSASWGGDQIVDFEDGIDILRFKTIIADDVKDFTITGNGTTDVLLAIGAQTLQLHGLKPIFIGNDDFQFFT
jgi:Ca2+-binding RTX toxin-like protein